MVAQIFIHQAKVSKVNRYLVIVILVNRYLVIPRSSRRKTVKLTQTVL